MAYSRIKVWIAAEILTASDLNAEHTGHINNENDLNTRLVAEISTRDTLEGEHDTLKTNLWSSVNNQVADNRVGQESMKNDAVHTAELKAGAVTDAKVATANKDGAAGTVCLRTLGTGAQQAMPGNATATPSDASVSQAKLKTSSGSVSMGSSNILMSTTYTGNVTPPGGSYGFQAELSMTGTGVSNDGSINEGGWLVRDGTGLANFSAVQTMFLSFTVATRNTAGSKYLTATQRYVTASGEIHWIFILRDKITKKIGSMWQAPDHPCFGNGGKPLLTPHPFGNYDETKHEIIVINPSLEEIEQMELETIVDDETKPDKDLLEVIAEKYEIDEGSNPAWPSIPVTVGLPKHIKDKKTGKKTLADYRFMGKDDIVQPIKKVIPQPLYVKAKKLKRK